MFHGHPPLTQEEKECRPFYSQRKRTAKGTSGGFCGEGGLVGKKVPPDDSPTFQLEKKKEDKWRHWKRVTLLVSPPPPPPLWDYELANKLRLQFP